jgi:hypothetical protein
MGPDPSDKSCKPPKFNVHQINASTSEIAQRQFCPHSSPWSRLQRMSQESPTFRYSAPPRMTAAQFTRPTAPPYVLQPAQPYC